MDTTDDHLSYGTHHTSNDFTSQSLQEISSLTQVVRTLSSAHAPADYAHNDGSHNIASETPIAGVKWDDPRLDSAKPQWDFSVWIRVFTAVLREQNLLRSTCGFMFRNLNVTGIGNETQLQQTVGSIFMTPFRWRDYFSKGREKHILRNFEGFVEAGEMLLVLGRPGSGCSTLLRTICGELHGLKKTQDSITLYDGLDQETFKREFRGEAVYSSEQENHFPHLTVGQTLEFAAAARTPSTRIEGFSRKAWSVELAKIVMAVYGLSHARNTKVGNDYIRGVSGGERKRVSLAEMSLAGAPIGAWDNSTRGLDSRTALEFASSLRRASDFFGVANAVAVYQASQSIYDLFDKVIVLYEGREIFFGPTSQAKQYFEAMGWHCPPRQTTGDFLTSVTNPAERQAKPGREKEVPRTATEFESYWLKSEARKALLRELDNYQSSHSRDKTYQAIHESHQREQAKHQRPESPYMLSVVQQTRLCVARAYQRLWNDKISTITAVVGNIIMALVIGSIYYGTPPSTSSFFSKGAILFFAVLLNALSSITEINALYDQRPIVRKQAGYAFYHPFAEALAGVIADLPVKFIQSVAFNIVLYFLGGLTYTAGKFFIFFLFIFITTLVMSAIFRTTAAVTQTVSQAMAVAGILILALIMYTGFTIAPSYQHDWFSWLRYINPISYAYEALLTNEVHGARYDCASLVPPYGTDDNFICATAGAQVGQLSVDGDSWVSASYDYSYSHIWRNLGILLAFMFFFYAVYLVATEFASNSGSIADYLVFRRGHAPKKADSNHEEDGRIEPALAVQTEEQNTTALPAHRDIFTWRDVTLDIQIKGEPRRLLDHVSGWVKPGTLTALMGTSGAGKTTLLDTLAQRMKVGVLTGDMFVNGKALSPSFQRSTGYAQQQDLHLETATVREALRFSAMLRRPKEVTTVEKYAFVEEVITMLGMQEFSEAVVGNVGEGLNVEQRKLLTIGVELAAKPDLLLFLDEPTSGLDSQASWSICAFLRKLADGGQAILCTIHQPSAVLFENFDRLLFLAKGGRTVYFGDVGANSRILLDYFEGHGARPCGDSENPAEYMLEIAGDTTRDWHETWKSSPQGREVYTTIDKIHQETQALTKTKSSNETDEFAMPLTSQLYHVTARVFQQYWRDPQYILGKFMLGIVSALFVGFSYFLQRNSQTGMQNLIFAVFMLASIFSTLVQQIMPRFVGQRSLYEVRERPSKTYSWVAFIFAQIIVEIPYQMFLAILVWACWYWPVFGMHQTPEQQGLMLLFIIVFYLFTSTFAHLLIAGLPDAATAGSIATLLFSLTLTFNGVLQPPSALPGFWIFMYRVSPLTYYLGGAAATGAHNISIACTTSELAIFPPPNGTTCADYLAPYLQNGAPGYLVDPMSTTSCSYCPLTVSDQYLAASNVYWSERWRNLGIFCAYVVFNVFGAVAMYYLVRVREGNLLPASLFKGMKKTRKPPAPRAVVHRFVEYGSSGLAVIRRFFTDKDEVPLEKKKTNDRAF